MRRDDERLADMLEAARLAIQFVKGRRLDELTSDELLAAALTHKIIVIGEAAVSVSPATKRRHPDIPWQLMIGMRNVVVHAYWQIDRVELWRTVADDLPAVIKALEAAETS